MNYAEVAGRLGIGEPSLHDILEALAKPGRDPRDDRAPPVFKKGILKLEDLTAGMELKGTVLNVVPFGAFVDIGLKDTGLVHISQMANRFIRDPYEVVSVGDVVTVWVQDVVLADNKAKLTMIAPGQERRAPAPRQSGPRPSGQQDRDPRDRPPAGPRPEGDRRDAPRPAGAGRGPGGPGGDRRGPGGPGGGGRGPGGGGRGPGGPGGGGSRGPARGPAARPRPRRRRRPRST